VADVITKSALDTAGLYQRPAKPQSVDGGRTMLVPLTATCRTATRPALSMVTALAVQYPGDSPRPRPFAASQPARFCCWAGCGGWLE
jgi:hypothetical protein